MWIFTSSDHCILLVFHKSSFLVSSSDVPPIFIVSFILYLSFPAMFNNGKCTRHVQKLENQRAETTTKLLFCSSIYVPKYWHPHRVK